MKASQSAYYDAKKAEDSASRGARRAYKKWQSVKWAR
jgi:hypothetical protein